MIDDREKQDKLAWTFARRANKMRPDPALYEEPLAREKIFQGNILEMCLDTVRLPNGKEATREVVVHSGAVAVIAVDDAGKLILVEQYRHPVGQVTLELTAGRIEVGEDILLAAQRELEEETGYRAKKWTKAMTFYISPGYSSEVMHIYLAESLTQVGPKPDEDEFLKVRSYSPEELVDMMHRGEIDDGKTFNGLIWYFWQTAGLNK